MRGHLLPGFIALALSAAELPRGTILDDVKCTADSSQGYALYIPSNYSADRAWSLILAFDPRARGRAAVERFQAAAETYGYIVAGSNNSRNGSWETSMASIRAMPADLGERFRIDKNACTRQAFRGAPEWRCKWRWARAELQASSHRAPVSRMECPRRPRLSLSSARQGR